MKTHYHHLTLALQSKAYAIAVTVLSAFFITATVHAFAQDNDKKEVKIKIIKIVDGDTTITEKTIDKSKPGGHHSFFMDEDGKRFEMLMEMDDERAEGRHHKMMKHRGPMQFHYKTDSAGGNAFAKCFVFDDSTMSNKGFTWNDSCMKVCMKNMKFDFEGLEKMMKDFEFDVQTSEDDKQVIIKTGRGKTIVINKDEEDQLEKSDDGKTKTKTKSFIVENEKGGKKKITVTTSVTVLEEDHDPADRVKDGESNNFSFYPNPSDGNFNLDLDLDGKKSAQVIITDITGKEVYNEKVSGKGKVSQKINLDGKKGTFIVTVKQGGKTQSKKIIIE